MSDSKKAILVASFGTTHRDTCQKTIGAIEERLGEVFSDRRMYRGWTSKVITGILKKRGIHVDTLEEALDRMAEDGITDVLVQPTHIMEGLESSKLLETLMSHRDSFREIRLGSPLLSGDRDLEKMGKILAEQFKEKNGREALLLMGHGTPGGGEANQVYVRLQEHIRATGRKAAYVGTVEGSPDLEEVMESMDSEDLESVVLTPLMIVAGDHATKDMAGDEESSWKNRLQARGYGVETVIKGLGEYEEVREMFADHARQAREI